MAIQEFLFQTVRAENSQEDEISVTCKTCKDSINFIGTFEDIFNKRRAWIEDHSCDVVQMNIHKASLDDNGWSVGCN